MKSKQTSFLRRLIRNPLGKLFDATNVMLMILFSITIIFPIWNMIVTSLSHSSDISYLSLNLWPKNWTFQAYEYCLNDPKFYKAFLISLARTVLGTLYHLTLTCLAAFVLTRREMPFRALITTIFMIPMFFSGGLIPQYLLYQNIGFINNFLVYILPNALSFFTIIIVRNFFDSIDKSLEESALIEGAKMTDLLLHIILPLSKPVLATITLWHMVGQWNSWFDNMAFASNPNLLTLQYLLRKIVMQAEMFEKDASAYMQFKAMQMHFNADTIKAATTVLIITPIVLTYPFLQKYFVKGIMIGAIKG